MKVRILPRQPTPHFTLEAVARRMLDGELEGLVVKDATAPYRDGSRAGWWKVKDRSRYEREAWQFGRR